MVTRSATAALSYTMRRDEPTRLEGFSDAVFGFSLTLLAFSLEVPGVELFDAYAGRRGHLISIAPGAASMVLLAVFWLTAPAFAGMAGIVYMLMGPAHGINGSRTAKARAKLLESRQPAEV